MRIIDLIISFCIIELFLASCSEKECNVLVIHSYEKDLAGILFIMALVGLYKGVAGYISL